MQARILYRDLAQLVVDLPASLRVASANEVGPEARDGRERDERASLREDVESIFDGVAQRCFVLGRTVRVFAQQHFFRSGRHYDEIRIEVCNALPPRSFYVCALGRNAVASSF